jgi:DNA-binding NarL/FixJ family response regulator
VSPVPARLIRILLADDHPVVLDGLRGYLEKRAGLQVIGEARTALAAVDLCRALLPDVVLMDHTLPGMSGIEALPHIRMVSPRTKVVVLTMQDDREYVREARRWGACGYLLKDAGPSEVVQAIEAVHAGDPFYTSGSSRTLLEELDQELERRLPESKESALSRREEQVLALVAAGLGSREISSKLGIGLRTVEAHRLRLRRKLGIRSVAGLTRYALDRGLRADSSPQP